MIRTLRRIFIPLLILFILGFLLMLVSQVSNVYALAKDVHPLFGQIVVYILSVSCLVLLLTPLYIYFKLPKPIRRPTSEEELPDFRKRLAKRLSTNQLLQVSGKTPVDSKNLEEGLGILEKEADKIINQTAKVVFLTTSVSQNGKLDALMILTTQVRMIWNIAHIYYQRPTLRELIYLYSGVGASTFLASEIEDLDISQQIEPVASAMLRNSSGKSIPLLGPAATLILDSIVEGSTNAYLTLRVGIVAKKYCGYPGLANQRQLRQAAVSEAGAKLREITISSSGKIISVLVKATKNAGVDTLKNSWEGVKKAGKKVKKEVVGTSRKMNPFGKKKLV